MKGREISSHRAVPAVEGKARSILGGMTGSVPVKALRVIVYIGVLMIGQCASEASFDITSCKSESVLREAIRATLRKEGLDGPLTILRDDTRSLRLWPSEAEKFIFYEVLEGGYGRSKQGAVVFMPVSHPLEWRVLVDCQTARVYRMFGFPSGAEFSAVVESLSLKVDEGGARVLTERFLELTYSSASQVVNEVGDLRRFFENEAGVYCDDDEVLHQWSRWSRRRSGTVTEMVKATRAVANGDGFTVTAYVADASGPMGRPPSIELHEVTVAVTAVGGTSLIVDKLVTTLTTRECSSE